MSEKSASGSSSASSKPAGPPTFPLVMAVGFVAAIVLSIVMSKESPTATTPAAPAPAPAAEAPKEPAEPAPTLESLKTELAGLTKQIKDIDAKIDAETKVDLEPIQAKIAELTKSSEVVAAVPTKLETIDGRLSELDKSLKALHDQVNGLATEVKKAHSAAPASVKPETKPDTATPKVEDVNVEGQSFSQAVDLFKSGKYKDANELLKTTEANDPKDARVWYYAAMTLGMTNNKWADAEKLALKGVACEKAGTPPVADIDAEFAKLDPKLKTWLSSYRKRAK